MAEWLFDHLSQNTGREIARLFIGDKIGEGVAREVYECRFDPNYVVKVETVSASFQNIEEWQAWVWARVTPKEKWLAPCLSISPTGYALLQRRVTPLRPREFPKKIPSWLCDIKPENFGWLDGRVVCIDYGTVLSCFQKLPTKMVKARWHK